MSGANEQQRDAGSRRGWWLVGLLAVSGAAVGAFAGYRIDPDVSELVPSLAAAGLGLGGLIGLVLLAPVGLWRAWRRRARRRAATSERADVPDDAGLWHTSGETTEPGHSGAEPPTAEPAELEREQEPEPEPEQPPPPAGGEPGWYPDPARDGVRRYWDGQTWTGHVWRGRARERPRKARNGR